MNSNFASQVYVLHQRSKTGWKKYRPVGGAPGSWDFTNVRRNVHTAEMKTLIQLVYHGWPEDSFLQITRSSFIYNTNPTTLQIFQKHRLRIPNRSSRLDLSGGNSAKNIKKCIPLTSACSDKNVNFTTLRPLIKAWQARWYAVVERHCCTITARHVSIFCPFQSVIFRR